MFGHSLTRRQALRLGALATAAGALRGPAPALAARPAVFELDLSGDHGGAAAGGWQTTRVLRAPHRFDLIGLGWAAGSHAEAQVRARRRGGPWTPWVALHPTGDHGPDEGAAPPGTDPAFTGTADLFQLRLRGNPAGLRARFVRALPAATVAGRLARRLHARARSAHQALAAPPAIIRRSAWGAASVPPRAPAAYGSVQMAFIHHTVTANTYRPEESAAIVLGIARYHRNSNGWNDIGYNFLVDRYGQIFEGRAGGIDRPVIGAQAQGYNSVSTGIACLGTFTSVAQTPAGMDALARVVGWKLSLHGVPVRGQVAVVSAGGASNRYPAGRRVVFQRISGHRDGDRTSCPGTALYAQLEELRTRAGSYATTATAAALSVRASALQLRAHKSVELSGSLSFADGASPAGAPLAIEFLAPEAAWTAIAAVTAGADGAWRATVVPPTTGTLRAVFAGDGAHAAATSAPFRIDVIPRMTVALDRRTIRRGGRVTIRGRVSPAQFVQCVVERRAGRQWVIERSRRLTVIDGAFGLRVRLLRAGSYRVTVISGTTRRRRLLRVR